MPKNPKNCPLCGKPPAKEHAPFCSRGCKDRDLLRWLDGTDLHIATEAGIAGAFIIRSGPVRSPAQALDEVVASFSAGVEISFIHGIAKAKSGVKILLDIDIVLSPKAVAIPAVALARPRRRDAPQGGSSRPRALPDDTQQRFQRALDPRPIPTARRGFGGGRSVGNRSR